MMMISHSNLQNQEGNTLTSYTDSSRSNLSHKTVPDSERQELNKKLLKIIFSISVVTYNYASRLIA